MEHGAEGRTGTNNHRDVGNFILYSDQANI